MLTTRSLIALWSVVILVLGTGVASGQDYPNRPIRVLASEVGGATDIIARMIAQGLTVSLSQPVIVENRQSLVMPAIMQQATPNGYTIKVAGTLFWSDMAKGENLSPITQIANSPYIVVVHPTLPVKSIKELIELAKEKPGQLNYSQGPIGGGVHLSGALFKSMSGVNMLFIPFSSASLGVNSLLAGETQVMMYAPITLMPHVKGGRLRALAVTSSEPSPLAPGLPTVAASGLPGYEYASMFGVFAPPKTPAPIINRLYQEIVRVINRPDVKEKFFSLGADIVGSTPAQWAAKTQSELAKWTKVTKDADIKIN